MDTMHFFLVKFICGFSEQNENDKCSVDVKTFGNGACFPIARGSLPVAHHWAEGEKAASLS